MRKQLKVLLLVAIVAVLFVMAMIVGSAEVDIYDGEEYVDSADTLAEAIAAAQEGYTIELTEDVTVDATITIDKSLTINGGDCTITSTAADYVFTFSTEGTINLKDINVSSTTAGLISLTKNGTYVLDDVNAEVKGLVLATTAASKNKFDGAYSFTASNCVWTSTATSGNLLSHSKYAINLGVAPAEGEYPVIYNLTNVTINTATTGHIVKIEGGFVTIDSCTINCTAAASSTGVALYNDTLSTKWVVKAESAPYKCEFNVVNFIGANKTNKVTIGRAGENDNIVVNASGFVVRHRASFVAPGEFVINGGTYACSGKTMIESDSDVKAEINNASFTCTNGAAAFGSEKSTNAKRAIYVVKDCQFDIAAGTMFNATGASAVVLVADCTGFVASALTVKYAAADYKLYGTCANFENSAEVGAGLYVDSTADGSGLRFETVISKTVIDDIIASLNAAIAKALEKKVDELTDEEKMTVAELELKFYTLIAPVDYVAKAGGVFTKAALDAADIAGTKYVVVEAVNSLAGINAERSEVDAAGVTYSAALVNLKSYTRGYAAISMIEYKNNKGATVTAYGDFNTLDNVRSAKQVADNMIADATSEYNVAWVPATDPKAAVVAKYATGIVG